MKARTALIFAACGIGVTAAAAFVYASGAIERTTPWAVRQAKDAIGRNLKDPTSLVLSELSVSPRGDVVCGNANAKNSYGAYAGKSGFVWREKVGVEVNPGDHSDQFHRAIMNKIRFGYEFAQQATDAYEIQNAYYRYQDAETYCPGANAEAAKSTRAHIDKLKEMTLKSYLGKYD